MLNFSILFLFRRTNHGPGPRQRRSRKTATSTTAQSAYAHARGHTRTNECIARLHDQQETRQGTTNSKQIATVVCVFMLLLLHETMSHVTTASGPILSCNPRGSSSSDSFFFFCYFPFDSFSTSVVTTIRRRHVCVCVYGR